MFTAKHDSQMFLTCCTLFLTRHRYVELPNGESNPLPVLEALRQSVVTVREGSQILHEGTSAYDVLKQWSDEAKEVVVAELWPDLALHVVQGEWKTFHVAAFHTRVPRSRCFVDDKPPACAIAAFSRYCW